MAIPAVRQIRAALGAVACMATVSCGGGDRNHASNNDSASGDIALSGDALSSDSLAGPPGGALLAMLTEWNMDIPLDTVAPGRYTFLLSNDGRRAHGLKVERKAGGGDDPDVEIARVVPGGATEITVDLEPGVYELSCPLKDAAGNHAELGMKRKLTVLPVRRNTT